MSNMSVYLALKSSYFKGRTLIFIASSSVCQVLCGRGHIIYFNLIITTTLPNCYFYTYFTDEELS